MCFAQRLATLIHLAIFFPHLKLPARRGPLFVDRARNLIAQSAGQGYAARIVLAGAFHAGARLVEFFHHLCRHKAEGHAFDFAVIKGNAKIAAAQAAIYTGVFLLSGHSQDL